MTFEPHFSFAQKLDENDPLKAFRPRFYIPEKAKKDVIYFCGHSLGLQPKATRSFVEQELEDWEKLGVQGHFHGRRPWVDYHKYSKNHLGNLLGATVNEVVSMGSLTENLHLLLTVFYMPAADRTKILIEKKAFPSDHYAVRSQLKLHGYNEDHLIELEPDQGHTYSVKHILDSITRHQNELALIMLPGVQYFSGQYFEIKTIAKHARKYGITIGFDLAHAIGNVPLSLHDDGVDFATWCSYKYLNSGPGGISGIFVHERNLYKDQQLKGWWGHDPASRFKMDNQWIPAEGVDAWQLSNPNILASAAHLAALELISEAGIGNMREKSMLLTGYLEYLIKKSPIADQIEFITPGNPEQRGAQLSLKIGRSSRELVGLLQKKGVIIDFREPDVIRVAPVPLYNTFSEVWQFVKILNETLKDE